jgi:hypothetical protein
MVVNWAVEQAKRLGKLKAIGEVSLRRLAYCDLAAESSPQIRIKVEELSSWNASSTVCITFQSRVNGPQTRMTGDDKHP